MRRGDLARSTIVALGVGVGIGVALGAGVARADVDEPIPWLGISFTAAPGQALMVTEVYPGTGAARAGVAAGDQVVGIDGAPLMSDEDLKLRVRRHPVGDRIRVHLVRDGQDLTLVARLGAIPAAGELLELRLLGSILPPMALVDRHDRSPVSLAGRPALLVVFDARCEPCGGAASGLVAAAADAGAAIAVRTVIVGSEDEVASYLVRNPVTGAIVRWDAASDGLRGAAVLSGLGRGEGAVLVVDHTGVIQFAASTADPGDVQVGALAAAARAQQRWRRRLPP